MPGRALIFDPMITHRILLKAQLSQDFFEISTVCDTQEFEDHLRMGAPDIILLSYANERAQGFSNLAHLKASRGYIPVMFLFNGDDTRIWDQSHDCLVDDVISYNADRWLITTRINQLIRGKEKIDSIVAQQRTISDMGFAEERVIFPPSQPQPVSIDFSGAKTLFPSGYLYDLATLLARDFPAVDLRTTPGSTKADVHVLDETSLGRDAAFEQLCGFRAAVPPASVLFCCTPNAPQSALRALELGAQDFCATTPNVPEMAVRLRRLIWQQQVMRAAEFSVSNHLQSALRDPLTGLFNRRYAMQHLSRMVDQAKASDETLTVMILDLDRFKTINDTYGHLTGDAVLRQTAERLTANLRTPDLVARLGGEEFLVVLRQTPLAQVRDIAERLCHEICATPFQTTTDEDITVSASIGVSETKTRWSGAEELIDCADIALYQSKDHGRNRVTFHHAAA